MPVPTDAELLALAACPPPAAVVNTLPPIDSVEERIALQNEILLYLVQVVDQCLCDNMVGIATALTKIERHLKRLVNKELKGTGQQLARIADYLQMMVALQIGSQQELLAALFGPISLIPAPPAPPEVEPEEQIPAPTTLQITEPVTLEVHHKDGTIETYRGGVLISTVLPPGVVQVEGQEIVRTEPTPGVSVFTYTDGTRIVFVEGEIREIDLAGRREIIPVPRPALPDGTCPPGFAPAPQFAPETSAAVGGGTFAAPEIGPSQCFPEQMQFGPVDPQPSELFIDLPEDL